jgi:hypothetical protein
MSRMRHFVAALIRRTRSQRTGGVRTIARQRMAVDEGPAQMVAAACAAMVAGLSLVYAWSYLVVAPAAQRGSDVGAFFRSYDANPAGLRIASLCLGVSGLAGGVAVVALAWRLGAPHRLWVTWAATAGVAAGLATSVHGFHDLLTVDRLADRYLTGDAATQAAIEVTRALPSAVDPTGLATFLVAGLVAATLGGALRPTRPGHGTIGLALGVDLVLLFAATAFGSDGAVLVTGGLASVVLGPLWWLGTARLLAGEERDVRTVGLVA